MHRAAFRPAARALARHAASPASRRFASTSPVDRPRSWKSSALRWGLAGGALYYYSTSSVFAEEPAHLTSPAPSHFSDEDLPTVDSVIEEKRKQIQERLESRNVVRETPTSTQPAPSLDNAKQPTEAEASQQTATAVEGSAAALEEEAGQQGAFNPETGEINWDCPCLGGMAHGPCGEEFKTAFSCFVYSDAEPKGMDCIEKFQGMQDCFRQHPDVYGAELAEDDAAEEAAEQHAEQHAAKTAATPDADAAPVLEETDHQQLRKSAPASTHNDALITSKSAEDTIAEKDPFPAKWDDATSANDAVNDVETPKQKEDKAKAEDKKA
ncbi:hypothetical protein NLU13_3714 [Sarocladium strictum]|uniref:Mitochondrial intermembrane space import and assembly protein 40 n=1 Tax=Sarocladium strictum TaxID=5046 RepID=A0AA39GMU4_SARSR|nr:hypothetical protein NLU13_3714 [Sarocladium strictum]